MCVIFFHYLESISEVLLKGSESDFDSSLFELGDFLELVWFKIVVTLNSHANRKPKFWNKIFWIFNKSEKMSKISIFVTLRLNYSWIRTEICFRYSLIHGEYGPFRILNYIWYVTYPKFKNLVIWLSRIVRSFPVPFSRRFNVHPRFLHSKTKRA